MKNESSILKFVKALLTRCFAVLIFLPVAMADVGPEASSIANRDAGRSISFEVVVDGTPEQIFENWATAEGVLQFLGSGSNIEPRVGGLYEIDFGQAPDGTILGPRDNRITLFEPGRALYFEWTMPIFAKELNTTPLPTWVEVRFEPFGSSGNLTLVKLSHLGFGRGDLWDRCYSFFERGWFEILFRLKLHRSYFVFSKY